MAQMEQIKVPAYDPYEEVVLVLEQIQKALAKDPYNVKIFRDYAAMLSQVPEEHRKDEVPRNEWYRMMISRAMSHTESEAELYEYYVGSLKNDAKYSFDAYMLFLESKRMPEERFYQPRRKILKRAVDGIQRLIDGELDEMFLSMPPRVGKTTLCMFLYTWLIGKDPEASNLYCAFSDTITSAFYSGILEILQDPYTYRWSEVFPDSKIVKTNSKEEWLNIDRNKRYPSLTCRSLYGTLNGATDCSGLLLSDDLIGGIEEALNPARMDAAWSKVDNNMLTRAKGGAKILWVGTRWSIIDPAGRRLDLLENDPKYKDRRFEVVTLPALNDKDESNFDYDYGVGFSTEYYHQRRASFEHNNDMASFLAQYQQMPVEREGALFSAETMRFFNGIIPEDQGVTKIFMAVDPAFGGGDFVAGPVGVKVSSGDIYIVDVIFDDRDKKETIPRLVDIVLKYGVRQVQFGVNKMTVSYKEEFEKALRERSPNHRIAVTSKADSSQKSKQQKIFDLAPNIRDVMVFLDSSLRSREYTMFMQNVYGFTALGKNRHDDAPDSLAMLADMDINPSGAYRIFRREF